MIFRRKFACLAKERFCGIGLYPALHYGLLDRGSASCSRSLTCATTRPGQRFSGMAEVTRFRKQRQLPNWEENYETRRFVIGIRFVCHPGICRQAYSHHRRHFAYHGYAVFRGDATVHRDCQRNDEHGCDLVGHDWHRHGFRAVYGPVCERQNNGLRHSHQRSGHDQESDCNHHRQPGPADLEPGRSLAVFGVDLRGINAAILGGCLRPVWPYHDGHLVHFLFQQFFRRPS